MDNHLNNQDKELNISKKTYTKDQPELEAEQKAAEVSPYHIQEAKTLHQFTKPEYMAVLFCVILGVLFARYMVIKALGFFSTLTVFSMVGAFCWYFKALNIKITKKSVMFLIIICAFSLVFSITDNYAIKFITEIFILVLGAYWVYFTCNKCERIDEDFGFEVSNALIAQPFSEYFAAPIAVLKTPTKSGGRVKHVVIGIVIAVPITIAVGSLLVKADKGIATLFRNLFHDVEFDFEIIIVQVLLGLVVACYLFGMLYANSKGKRVDQLTKSAFETKRLNRRVIPNAIVYTALTPTIALYILFFIMQSSYFLSAFTGVLPDGFSYAEFARRGFFELFFLAIINFVFVVFINSFTINSGKKRTKTLRMLTFLLCGFTILIIATSLSKMFMYISRFGLTQLRLYTSWTMILMAVVFVLIIVLQFKPKLNIVREVFCVFVVMMAILCFSQSDYHIAKYNITMYNSGYHKELDTDYLSYELSYDAFNVLQENDVYMKAHFDYQITDVELASNMLQADFTSNKFANYNISKLAAMAKLEQIAK